VRRGPGAARASARTRLITLFSGPLLPFCQGVASEAATVHWGAAAGAAGAGAGLAAACGGGAAGAGARAAGAGAGAAAAGACAAGAGAGAAGAGAGAAGGGATAAADLYQGSSPTARASQFTLGQMIVNQSFSTRPPARSARAAVGHMRPHAATQPHWHARPCARTATLWGLCTGLD